MNIGAAAPQTTVGQGTALFQPNVIQGTAPIPAQGAPLQTVTPTGEITETKTNTEVDGAAA